jgi:isopenicillin N synthase-like dioxygenase
MQADLSAPTFAVPVVDLDAPGAATALTDTLASASFAFVTNHGVDLDLRRRMHAVSREFFGLPRDDKAKVRWPGTGYWHGWQPVYEGAEDITGTRVPDLVERFEVQELDTYSLWPEQPADFVAVWTEYYRSCAALSSRLMTMMAESLDLPRQELAAWTDGQFANLVANNYPAQPEPPQEGQVRVGSHTDRGGFTLLWADQAPGGLEVKVTGSNSWTPVAFPPDVFLVQAGDLLARWTNNVIRANVHRVVNPPREVAAASQRTALVYFHYPTLEATITPAPSCVGDGKALPSVLAGEHLLRRQEQFKVSSSELYAGV